ncbi:hypothetical protein SPOG_02295 [Schizosaccharomyces cryophilus OY26]|uniref:Uncharacterized protein n=1 Tax=Schizosaccharomyces cryophilus (strain OY26 / ATCC MYA-4695 / CBS 11777 / NBRC 106824 / NRRL Y48691) TaxID=653667 RepID=S9XBF7_SCHCR|nr:uncharacterized protein SPOG_02295 [Schizosaccharomyces cryophilus OY26]EPY51116.1 hypothetical protein SPOG_02295 [Schizosaccharomyces cryophilus OY26]
MDLFAIDLDFEPSEVKTKREKRLEAKVTFDPKDWTPRIQDFGHLSKDGVVLGDPEYILEQCKFAAEEQYYLRNYQLAKTFALQAMQEPANKSIEYHRLTTGEVHELKDIVRRCEEKQQKP